MFLLAGLSDAKAGDEESEYGDISQRGGDRTLSSRAEARGPKSSVRKRKNRSALNDVMGADLEEINNLIRKPAPKKKRKRIRGPKELSPALATKIKDAMNHFIDGDYGSALSLSLEVIKEAPRAPEPYTTMGTIYESIGETKKALEAYVLAATLAPKDVEQWKNLVLMARDHDMPRQTLFCLDKIIRLAPDDLEARFERAKTYKALGDHPKAIDNLKYIQQQVPRDAKVLQELADSYHATGGMQHAITLLEEYVNFFKEPKRNRPARPNDDPQAEEMFDLNVVNVLCELYLIQQQYQDLINMSDTLEKYQVPLCLLSLAKRVCACEFVLVWTR